jgi:Ras-related protein Rab-5C
LAGAGAKYFSISSITYSVFSGTKAAHTRGERRDAGQFRFEIIPDRRRRFVADHANLKISMDSSHDLPAFKLVLLGDSGVGKTTIVQQFDSKTFDHEIDSTIGASFLSKEMQTRAGHINLHIWDTTGQERYRSLVPTYARGAASALICFDMTAEATFQSVDYWFTEMDKISCTGCIVCLVGNKTDLPPVVIAEDAMEWAKSHQMKFFAVSAKTGENVDKLFQEIAEDITERRPSAVPQYDHLLTPEPAVQPASPCC